VAKTFRRPRPGEVPTTGSDDELLDDPPDLEEAWSLRAYAAGSRVRGLVFGTLIVGSIGAGVAGYWYVGSLQDRRAAEAPTYVMDPSSVDPESRILYWSDGIARLGLNRAAPGVRAIVLPDRVIELADGSDHAQIKVEVRNGETVRIQVVKGRVKQTERALEPAQPGSGARAP
jgi:hypothetical protein